MIDSIYVLDVLKLVYTIYALLAISLIAWFGWRLTKGGPSEGPKAIIFYTYIAILVIGGTGLHFISFHTIPWVPLDLKRREIKPDKVFKITYQNHQIIPEQKPMRVKCGEKVLFEVESKDLTYGFGIFREDHTMVTQMQVVPKSKNDLLWSFVRPGKYYVRSTEYSGPKGAQMILKDAIVVENCEQNKLSKK